MAQHKRSREVNPNVNLDESSVYGAEDSASVAPDDVATEATLDRLEEITGGADDPDLYEEDLEQQVDELEAGTEEEVDALKVNLLQDDALPDSRDGSGLVSDDVAEEELARFTEVGPMQDIQGAATVAPGRDDTSAILRSHHPNSEIARSEDVVEGNLDEPRDEEVVDRKVDEGTAA